MFNVKPRFARLALFTCHYIDINNVLIATGRIWTEIKDLTLDRQGQEVLLRARMQTARMLGMYILSFLICII